jgi:adenosylmethionine-8-amino-7-oxononanoate aminotransferase
VRVASAKFCDKGPSAAERVVGTPIAVDFERARPQQDRTRLTGRLGTSLEHERADPVARETKRKREPNRAPTDDDYWRIHAKIAAPMTSRSRHWLPFTQMQSFDRASRTFVRGDGATLVDAQNRRVFDATSSIWTIVHGHGHPRIVDAIARQARTLDHATALGATNPVAEELAERLCALTNMDYAFFSSDGASAIEAALKMTLQYWQQVGEPQRTRFVRFVDAYHGDTTGAMSVSDIAVFKARFGAITFDALQYGDDVRFDDDVAGVIVEPMVQAAAGMRVVAHDRYDALRHIKPLLIVDEIATGFGRTGTMFAHEQLGIRPDLLCLGKGMTGGVLPLSATIATSRVYDAFLGKPGEVRHFFHGHSFAGNPIACAAALASLDLFDEENTLEHARRLADRVRIRGGAFADHPAVREIRQRGLMIGIELSAQVERGDAPTPGWRVANGLYERGHFTRPIGDVVQLVPPLSSSDEQIDEFFDALAGELAS